jgi:hypothetical protein
MKLKLISRSALIVFLTLFVSAYIYLSMNVDFTNITWKGEPVAGPFLILLWRIAVSSFIAIILMLVSLLLFFVLSGVGAVLVLLFGFIALCIFAALIHLMMPVLFLGLFAVVMYRLIKRNAFQGRQS